MNMSTLVNWPHTKATDNETTTEALLNGNLSLQKDLNQTKILDPHFCVFKKKFCYEDGNDVVKPFFAFHLKNINIAFANTDLLMAFLNAEYQYHIDLDILWRHVDFVTTSCCFQAPRHWCKGTGPPSSSLLIFGPTEAKRKKKRGWPY